MIARLLHITGRVQGVGFRWYTREVATAHGVSGWVRNRRDGAVEAELHGEASAVAAVEEALRHGPPGAAVTEVSAVDLPTACDVPDGFEIRATE